MKPLFKNNVSVLIVVIILSILNIVFFLPLFRSFGDKAGIFALFCYVYLIMWIIGIICLSLFRYLNRINSEPANFIKLLSKLNIPIMFIFIVILPILLAALFGFFRHDSGGVIRFTNIFEFSIAISLIGSMLIVILNFISKKNSLIYYLFGVSGPLIVAVACSYLLSTFSNMNIFFL